jgi:hypothetical protein
MNLIFSQSTALIPTTSPRDVNSYSCFGSGAWCLHGEMEGGS